MPAFPVDFDATDTDFDDVLVGFDGEDPGAPPATAAAVRGPIGLGLGLGMSARRLTTTTATTGA
jgi:hypothetical protein